MFATLSCRFAVLIAAAGVLAASIGCDPAAGLHGKWQVDSANLQTKLAQGSGGKLAGAAAKMMLSLTNADSEFEFKPDGTCQATIGMLGQSASAAGQWRFVRREGDSQVVRIQMDSDAEGRELKVKLIDDEHLEMPLPGSPAGASGQAVPFVRVKSQ